MNKEIDIIRFSEGFWPDLLYTAGFVGKFLLFASPAILFAFIVNYWLGKSKIRNNFFVTVLAIVIAFYTGYAEIIRLDYSLESIGYMIASASSVLVLLIIACFFLYTKSSVWQNYFIMLLCGLIAAEISLKFHLEVEKFTYFSEKLYIFISSNQNALHKIAGEYNFSLFSFGLYIGLAEEFFKFFFLIVPFYKYLRRGEMIDVILLTLFISAGFAAYENIIYAYNFGVNISIVRNVFNGHLFLGVFTAMLLIKIAKISENKQKRDLNFVLLIFPVYLFISLLHGVWDFAAVSLSDRPMMTYLVLGGCYLTMIIFAVWKLIIHSRTNYEVKI